MSFAKWLAGERVLARGGEVVSVPLAKPFEEPRHEHLRDYLDSVFNWINSKALFSQAEPVAFSELRPGDFLVHDGKPGDAVVVLDMAVDRQRNRTLVMLGQALSPAQNVHIVSPGGGIAWFEVSATTPLVTPHTEDFSWENLRRLP